MVMVVVEVLLLVPEPYVAPSTVIQLFAFAVYALCSTNALVLSSVMHSPHSYEF